MFESLSDRLGSALRSLGGRATLDEKNIQDALREVRLALLEADVHVKVVKEFTDTVRERALGLDVAKNLSPAQQVLSVVREELINILGGETAPLNLDGKGPHAVMMVGLQGSGKTTSTAKIANYLRDKGQKPFLVPADVYRPAAIDQLTTLAGQLGLPVFASTTDMNPVDIAQKAMREAAEFGYDVVLLDTAGRLHVDAPLMQELASIKEKVAPREILFVADAMTGQDAVAVAEAFNEAIAVTGVVLTKMDGDARGGAALSIKSVTGANVKFVGTGEKVDELELFHPDRIAGRILGMGDMLTLIEKAQASIAEEEAEELARKMERAEFNLEDFRTQMRRLKGLGSLEGLLKLIPGLGGLSQKLGGAGVPEKEMARTEAIINSMTPQERRNPKIINASRRQRIANGSGVPVAQVNQLLKQFEAMRAIMKKGLGKGRMPALPGLGGLGGSLGGFPGMSGMAGAPAGGLSKAALKKKREQRKAERQRKKKKR